MGPQGMSLSGDEPKAIQYEPLGAILGRDALLDYRRHQ